MIFNESLPLAGTPSHPTPLPDRNNLHLHCSWSLHLPSVAAYRNAAA